MKKVIIAPDSFKETFTSIEVATLIKEVLSRRYDYDFIILPISDGGEGTLDILEYSNVIDVEHFEVIGPNFEKITAKIGFFKNKKFAIIESAEVVGFKNQQNNSKANNTTSYGIGQLIKIALNKNLERIYVSLGGTITNDGGCGMLSALGINFYNSNNEKFIPTGKTLKEIVKIENDINIGKVEIIGLTDVNNPLLGINGATHVYAKQKRASEEEINEMEKGMINYSNQAIKALKIDRSTALGAGAAGGLGYALTSFLNAQLVSGISSIFNFINFEEKIKDASLIITGEGKVDSQSFSGKAISGVIDKANKYDIEVLLLVGILDCNKEDLKNIGINKIYSITKNKKSIEEIKKNKIEDLFKCLEDISL